MENISNFFGNKDSKYLFLFLLMLGLSTTTGKVVVQSHFFQKPQNPQIQISTFDPIHPNPNFEQALAAYRANPTKENLDALVSAAKQREDFLKAQISNNPDLFLSNVLPANERKSLPVEILPYVEHDVQTKGGVSWFHADSWFSNQDVESYSLDQKYGLHFPSNVIPPLPKSYISATGVSIDNDLVLTNYLQQQTSNITSIVNSAAAENNYINVILVNFTGNTPPKHTLDQIKNTLMGSGDEQGTASVSKYYQESSYGKQSFTFSFHDWITVSGIASGYSCDWNGENAIRQALDKAVTDNHLSVDANSTRVYYTNASFCAGGSGSVNVEYGLSYPSVVIPNDGDGTGVLAHELGHTLGLQHAASRTCKNANDYTNNCTDSEYGDGYDIMGGPLDQFNGPHKIELGYINAGQVQTVTTNGIYSLTPLETQSSGVQVIKIAKPDASGWYYYLEYRTSTGFDSNIQPSVQIHLWNDQINNNDPWHPGSPYPYHTYRFDPILSDGQTFTDSVNKITIKMDSHDSSKATVEINTGANPTATPSPTAETSTVTVTPSPTPEYTCTANADLQTCIPSNNSCALQAVGTCASGQVCCSLLTP